MQNSSDLFRVHEGRLTCPSIIDCSSKGGRISFDLGKIPSYVSISSSSLSCFGSLLILFAYFKLSDIRTGSQKIITLLAIADLFTALGYIAGSVNFITHFKDTVRTECKVFTYICEIQSFVTTWSSMASYSWTCILAFYFFMILVFHKPQLASKLLPLYNVLSWFCPLLIAFPLLVMGKLGYAPYVTSNWCYIRDTHFYKHQLLQKPDIVALLLVGGRFWEMLSYIIVVALYLCIRIFLSKSKRATNAQVSSIEKRLLAIPLLYILLRMWGTLQFFYSIIVDHTNDFGCIPVAVQKTYFVFGILQAIGDGGQGWGNAILYIFLSPSIRQRLFSEPCNKCWLATERTFQELLETETMSHSVQEETKVTVSVGPSEPTVAGGNPATGYEVTSYRHGDTTMTVTTDSRSVSYTNSLPSTH